MLLITHTPLSLFSRSLLKYKSQAKWHYSTSYAPQAPEAPKPHTTSDVSDSDALPKYTCGNPKITCEMDFSQHCTCEKLLRARVRPQESPLTGAPEVNGAALCHA